MEVLVSKPQFDTNILQAGSAIRVKSISGRNEFYDIDNDCLIVKCSPLGLRIAYLKNKSVLELDLPLEMVTSGAIIIKRCGG